MSLSPELMGQTVAMCGKCVGKNLYTKEMLIKALEQPMKELTVDAVIEKADVVTDFVDDFLDGQECPLKAKMQENPRAVCIICRIFQR